MPDEPARRPPTGETGARRRWRLAWRGGLSPGTLPRMEVPGTMDSAAAYRRFALLQFVYSLAGLVLGAACVVGGIVLFLRGVAGSASWTASILGAESQISDTAPGAVLFLVGLFIVLITRFTIEVRK